MTEALGLGELLGRLAALEAALAQRDALIAQLQAENAQLRRRLGMNLGNSSKPPSTDSPFAKPAPKSLRRRSGRKPGGQPGHLGTTLRQVDIPMRWWSTNRTRARAAQRVWTAVGSAA